MEKKAFQAESQRLLDLMIHSIYTHKEIFLREIISNASDAVDKLAYRSLTDDKVGLNRSDFKITITPDKEARTLTISDNGVGMTREELEQNLGIIAKSGSLQFKRDLEAAGDAATRTDIIGQFGVGFYSAFMVSDRVVVTTRAYGSDEAWCWESTGADGYTVAPCEKENLGTDIVLYLKENADEEDYDQYLQTHQLETLVKKYSDYIRHPVVMEMERSRMKPKPEDAAEDAKPEYETVKEWETLNSMVPLWQRPKAEVTSEEYNEFYQQKFGDWEAPVAVVHVSAEGMTEYKSILYIPARAPFDYNTRDYQRGLQLYSSGVLIMDKCADLIPDCFGFVRGVVDSPDVSLNISREMLQHTRELKVIGSNLEKKIKAELLRLQSDDREKYEAFFATFGRTLKYGVVADYGIKKELLKDLLLFWSSKEGKQVTLAEYQARMAEDQTDIYYLQAESVEQAAKLPQAERILDKGYEILYLVDEVDEFLINALGELDGKKLKNVSDADALPESEDEKQVREQKSEENKDVLDFVKETLGQRISEVRLSKILKSAPVFMTAEGPVSLEMEKYFSRVDPEQAKMMKAQRVLELNPESGIFAALCASVDEDKERAKKYAEVLYHQALLIAGLPLEDPTAYTELVCSLLQ